MRREGWVPVAVDDYLELYVNGKLYATIVLSPVDLEEVVIGTLFGDGIIESLEEVVEISKEGKRVMITLSGPREGTARAREDCLGAASASRRAPAAMVSWDVIRSIYVDFNKRTGSVRFGAAVHTSAIYDLKSKKILISHDVSRHTSISRLIGMSLKSEISPRDSVAITTGRASADMVSRLVRLGIPIIVSTRGPVLGGIAAARALGATLIVYLRWGKPGLYVLTHEERIAGPKEP